MTVETIIEDGRWKAAGLAALADTACSRTLERLGLAPERFDIAVLGCDDARIALLNADFRGRPRPTNVLSWPSEERAAARPGARPRLPEPPAGGPPLGLGDIAISHDSCMREVAEFGRDPAFHISHLLVHATLHLLGYDHIAPQDAVLMEAIEVQTLASLGYPNPYE